MKELFVLMEVRFKLASTTGPGYSKKNPKELLKTLESPVHTKLTRPATRTTRTTGTLSILQNSILPMECTSGRIGLVFLGR